MTKILGTKPNGNRKDLINWRLEYMTNLAIELKQDVWSEAAQAQANKYIRINGESYRAVSLADESPLCQFSKTGSPTLSIIKSHFEKTPDPNGLSLEKKRERRLQSRIIKQALMKSRNLLDNSLFGEALKGQFDELIFALDEISFGDKNHLPLNGRKNSRCDLVAVGKYGDEVFPVVIELKYTRSLGILFEQLDNVCTEINKHHDKFFTLLETVTGMSISKNAETRKILVWPALGLKNCESKNTRERREHSDVLFIEYSPKEFISPSEIVFCQVTGNIS
jgi:hypothetical protein